MPGFDQEPRCRVEICLALIIGIGRFAADHYLVAQVVFCPITCGHPKPARKCVQRKAGIRHEVIAARGITLQHRIIHRKRQPVLSQRHAVEMQPCGLAHNSHRGIDEITLLRRLLRARMNDQPQWLEILKGFGNSEGGVLLQGQPLGIIYLQHHLAAAQPFN